MVAGYGWLENWTRQKPVLGDSSQRRLERRNISNYFLQMEQSHCLDEVRFPKIQQGKEHNDVPQGESDGSQPSDTVEKLDASEIYRRRINAKDVLISKKRVKILSSKSQMEQQNCLEELMESENTEELQGNSERSQRTEAKDDAEDRSGFLSIEGDFIYRHHVEPRVTLRLPKEESFPMPLE